jgi:hypothetical protein
MAPIEQLLIKRSMRMNVAEVSLTHLKLGETAASYGQATVDGKDMLLVVTEGESGGTLTARFTKGSPNSQT